MADGTPRRRSHKLRKIAGVLAIFVVALLLVFALAGPAILAAAAPMVAHNLGIPGRLVLKDVALSWTGQLTIDDAALYNAQNEQIAGVSVQTGGGLLGLFDAYVEQDITIDGWAAVRMDEQGITNIERALGIERGQDDTPAKDGAGPPRLPFDRVVLDGLDVAFTQAGKPTLAIAGLQGEILADGSRIKANLDGSLGMPDEYPATRQAIAEAPQAGLFEAQAEIGLEDLTGDAHATIEGLTPAFAQRLGALSGNDAIAQSAMIAARGGLALELDADLMDGLPVNAAVSVESQTVRASLALSQRDGALRLETPGSVEIDSSAFLADEAIRSVALPAQGVRVDQAGSLSLEIQDLMLPIEGGRPDLARLETTVRANLGPSILTVPGGEGEDARVQLRDVAIALDVAAGSPISLRADAKAAVNGQPEGALALDGRADTAALSQMLSSDEAIGVAGLSRAVPTVELKLTSMPVLAAKPWLAALENLGLDLAEITGPTLDATLAWTGRDDNTGAITLDIETPHAGARAALLWSPESIALSAPAAFRVDRPAQIAAPWLPEGWTMSNGQGVRATVPQFSMPMDGFTPRPEGASASVRMTATGPTVTPPTGPAMGLQNLELNVDAAQEQTTLKLAASPTVGDQVATLDADLQTAGVGALLGGDTFQAPPIFGQINAAGPTRIARAFPIDAAGRPLHQWLADALGPRVALTLDLAEPAEGDLVAGELTIDTMHARAHAVGLHATTSSVSFDGATLRATPTKELWNALAGTIGMEGSTLAQSAPLVAEIGPAAIPFGQGGSPLDGLGPTTVSLRAENAIRVNGVPTRAPDEAGERARTDVILTALRTDLNSLGRALTGRDNLEATLDLKLESPDLGRLAAVDASAQSDAQGDLTARATIDDLRVREALALAGVGEKGLEAAVGSLGQTGRVVVNAQARATPEAALPWSPSRVSIDLDTPRLTTSEPITATIAPQTIALAQPTVFTWTPDAAWLASTVGAQITMVQPLEIRLDRVAMGNPMTAGVGLLDPTLVALEASLDAKGATIEIPERPSIELASLTARLRRIAQNNFSITANASTEGGGTVELNGLVQNPADAQGRLALETAQVRGTIKGNDVPVALADALSNTDGLLADALGPVVDLDAEIQRGKLIPGEPPQADLRFSIRGPRADASGYGRLANHRITMQEPQTILTVHEVRPEITGRFSEIIPELLQVEKRPADGPAIIRTQGLTIPTNGQWVHGQGEVTIALGTARFRSTSVLSSVLKAAGQREQGSLGRRIEPIHITMVDGVINYEPFTLPLGDLEIESEGTVNLVQNTMDVIVWIPVAALSDEAAGQFNTGLGSALGRTVPGFGSVSTVPWRVSGELSGPSIRPAPQVLIRRRGSELLGPLLRPGESLQDLLSIPGTRREPREGGR